jgi:hypothetical protein
MVAAVSDWVTAYAEMKVIENLYNKLCVPNLYISIGDLDKSDFYGFIGKKTIEFGNLHTNNNLIPTLMRQYFMSHATQAGFGLSNKKGLDIIVTLANNDVNNLNFQTSRKKKISNVAVSTSYKIKNKNVNYFLTGSYTNATGFSRNISGSQKNSSVGAFDISSGITKGGLTITTELILTTKGVAGFNETSYFSSEKRLLNSNSKNHLSFNSLPIIIKFDSKASLKAWSMDSSYNFLLNKKEIIPYALYNQITQNSQNYIYQLEMGMRYNIHDNFWLGSSYNFVTGKSKGQKIGKFNTFMLDINFYF